MAEQKIFAGPRIRRIRKARDLTQTAMAAALGISPSYLNLIERNQRFGGVCSSQGSVFSQAGKGC